MYGKFKIHYRVPRGERGIGMSEYIKAKDLYFLRRNSDNTKFEESPLIVTPDTVLYIDSGNNLTSSYISDLISSGSVASASVSMTASYYENGISNNQLPPQISVSGITSSLYGNVEGTSSWASNAVTSSYALNGGTQLETGSLYDITSSWSIDSELSLTSSFMGFDGSRAIKRSGYVGVNVGGSSVVEFLNNFFFPFVPATVLITSGGGTYQTGSIIAPTLINVITGNDETSYGSSSMYKNGVQWQNTISPTPLGFSFNDSNITTNTTYQTFVQTNNNGNPTVISSNSVSVNFLYPFLWGISADGNLSGASIYNTFTKQIVTKSNKSVALNGSQVYIYFCYPSSYSSLSSILDPNSFEILSSFSSSIVAVTSSGLSNNWTENYIVYKTILISDPNGTFQFKF